MNNEEPVSKIAIAVLQLGSIPLDAVAIKYLWQWFVVPLGVPRIDAFQALGISLLVGLMSHQYIPGRENADVAVYSFCAPLAALGFGFLFHAMRS